MPAAVPQRRSHSPLHFPKFSVAWRRRRSFPIENTRRPAARPTFYKHQRPLQAAKDYKIHSFILAFIKFCRAYHVMAPAIPPSSRATLGKLARRALLTGAPALTSHHIERRGLSVNHTQGVTLGVIAAYVVIIALLWNLPYVRWVLWPFKVCLSPSSAANILASTSF